MSRSKKQKLTSSSSQEDFSIYLRDPSLIDVYHRLTAIDISPGRFVRFADFMDFNLHKYFEDAGLLELYDLDNLSNHYPSLIYLFFANLTLENSMNENRFLHSFVKGNELRLTPKSIGEILNIPTQGIYLEQVEMNDENILHNHILIPGKNLPMLTKNLRPTAKLVSRIISYNLLPKTGSFDHMSHDLQLATYAIMANIKVNWSRVMFDILHKHPTTFLPYGAFLTRIFENFQVDLDSEKNVISYNEVMDKSMLARMKLSNYQIPGAQATSSSTPSQSRVPPSIPSSHHSYSFDDPFIHNLTTQLSTLTTGQERLMNEHEQLFRQNEQIMKMQMDINARMDGIYEEQHAIRDILYNHFPPRSPPPPSP